MLPWLSRGRTSLSRRSRPIEKRSRLSRVAIFGPCLPLAVWRRYNGRADIENRIKELGEQFGIKRLAARSFWATEAMHHLVITAYNLCVLLQRRLGQLEKCELNTLRWRRFSRAAVWSRKGGKPTLKFAVRGEEVPQLPEVGHLARPAHVGERREECALDDRA